MQEVTGSIPVSPTIRRDVLNRAVGQSVPRLGRGKVTGSIPVSPAREEKESGPFIHYSKQSARLKSKSLSTPGSGVFFMGFDKEK
jgi:hypothetical protein